MNEKEMLERARMNPQAKSDLTIEEARAQLREQERRDAEKTRAEMKRLGIRDPVKVVLVLQDQAAEKRRKLEEAGVARRSALAEDAQVKAREDADLLDAINEWRAEEPYGMPQLTSLADATHDERDAAEAGDSRLLRRRTNGAGPEHQRPRGR